MSYIVHNLTNRTLVLSDLRVEIKPNTTVDLERFAKRADIERSSDLITAIQYKKIRAISSGMSKLVQAPQPTQIIHEKIIEKESISSDKLEEIVRKVMKENSSDNSDLKKVISDAIQSGLANINTVQPQLENATNIEINPEELAKIHQQGVKQELDKLESNQKTSNKKVIVSNDIRNIANEL